MNSPRDQLREKAYKFSIGDNVRWTGMTNLVTARVVNRKGKWFRKYQIIYGIGDFGVKTAEGARWVPESELIDAQA